jgi:hypothetical protein
MKKVLSLVALLTMMNPAQAILTESAGVNPELTVGQYLKVTATDKSALKDLEDQLANDNSVVDILDINIKTNAKSHSIQLSSANGTLVHTAYASQVDLESQRKSMIDYQLDIKEKSGEIGSDMPDVSLVADRRIVDASSTLAKVAPIQTSSSIQAQGDLASGYGYVEGRNYVASFQTVMDAADKAVKFSGLYQDVITIEVIMN